MPIIEVKAFDRRFDGDEELSAKLIEGLTQALVDVYGEDLRDETWVILEGVKPTRWGFGGKLRNPA